MTTPATQLNQDFVTYQGDTVTPIFTVLDASGNPVDISAATEIAWSARQSLGDPVALLLTKTGGQVTLIGGGTTGQFEVAITALDTESLSGFYTQYATLSLGGAITTVIIGRMKVGQAPNWTYNAAAINTSPLYQVRRLIGDVVNNDQQMLDQEILFALGQRSTIYGAAADCCQYLADQFARQVDAVTPGGLTTNFSAKSKQYAAMALRLNNMASLRGAGAMPYAGGISVQDKIAVEQNPDRVTPQFNLYMTDNFIVPAGNTGNEVFAGNPVTFGTGTAGT